MCQLPPLVDLELVVVVNVTGCVVGEVLFLGFLIGQVRLVEESREQNEIAEVHRETEVNVPAGDVTVHMAVLQVLISGYVDGTADHHLGELCRGDHHGDRLGRSVPHRFQGIVRIHDGMDAVVHHDVPSRGCGVFRVRKPRVQQHSDMVVPVQEDQRLLAQHDENRVAKLG